MNTKSTSFSSLGTSGFCRGTASSHATRRPHAGAEGRLFGGEGHPRGRQWRHEDQGRCGRERRGTAKEGNEEMN